MTITVEQGRAATVVFYDGGCPLCSREISHYARMDRAGMIAWVDITRDQTLMTALGVTFEQAMQRLLVLDRNGLLVDGARAFLAIWSELPRYRVLARLIYRCGALTLLEKAYARFAARRYRARCQSLACASRAVT